ncbi:hypothetical protein MGSAQ_000666 [marine sediment metagenome]|uniref:Uncharacterized protein n=1 Tax=marine sediment metagenome TaxID=412755 RepID=A0A1B6NWV2_9ZZZZ
MPCRKYSNSVVWSVRRVNFPLVRSMRTRTISSGTGIGV